MTVIDPQEEVLRFKRYIAVDLLDRVIEGRTKPLSKEDVWETYEYFFTKLTE